MKVAATITVLLAGLVPSTAEARVPTRCPDAKCRAYKERVIRPYRSWFLGPVGACESGTDRDLRHGLRAVGGGGRYRGRYQFGIPDWYRAGAVGDPVRAGWREQAFRAVRWLHINGRSSWPNC